MACGVFEVKHNTLIWFCYIEGMSESGITECSYTSRVEAMCAWMTLSAVRG